MFCADNINKFYNFYSRPCGRGDAAAAIKAMDAPKISTHAPAGGATRTGRGAFLSAYYFYSRPCGRGDPCKT